MAPTLDPHRAQILYDVARRALVANDVPDVIATALSGLQDLVPAYRYSVGLIDTARYTYRIFETAGRGRGVWSPGGAFDLSQFGGDLRALRRGEVQLQNNLSAGGDTPFRSQLILPIRHQGLLLGTLNLASDRSHAFTDDHCTVAKELADLIAVALSREHLRQELVRAYDHAKEASDAKTRFLAQTSHELRTPLNAIIGYVELILEDGKAMPREDIFDDLGRVHAAGEHLLTLINQVLDLEKVESGRSEITLASMDLSALLEDIDDVVSPLVTRGNNRWVVDCDPEVWVLGDPLRLRQVLLNLVGNSAKFTQDGEVRVAVTSTERTVAIAVTDTGIGIPADKMDTLFEPFTQAHADTPQYGGTGLGLAIAQRYVEMMGGQISVSSRVGEGSTFTVTLLRTLTG